MALADKRLVVVSNRLPINIARAPDGDWSVEFAPGGLVTALAPIMQRNRGLWIGWPGCGPEAPIDRLLRDFSATRHYDLRAVPLTDEEIYRYYRGHANRTIWPLFHDLLGYFRFDYENWTTYCDVNRRFAEMIVRSDISNSFVWVHDYQLIMVGRYLREMGVTQNLSFFLHIPFPSYDLYRRLPWKEEILEAMLDYDHIGFQTAHDRRNFIHCLKWLVPEARRVEDKRQTVLRYGGRNIIVGHYPISIDFHEFDSHAREPDVARIAAQLQANHRGRTLALGLDRLDYTKGIPERFLAFERMLEKYPETVGCITLIQIVVPSRLNVPDYQALKEELDSLAGRINSRFSQHGWTPIHYQFRSLERPELLGHYRACEIALVTPLRDGMNLVAKEYCAASIDESGVLILSEFAGAAQQLAKGALLVNPYDMESTADALYAAFIMSAEEQRRRMRLLRQEVRRNDVNRWVRWFLKDAHVGPEYPEPRPEAVIWR